MRKIKEKPSVVAVCSSPEYSFSKFEVGVIDLLPGLGVRGDVHCGKNVKHRSQMKKNSSRPNLRQVHLIQCELFESLKERGFQIDPCAMGENITTVGIDLLALPRGACLHIGATAVVEITGLRNPCSQLDNFQKGLTEAVLERKPSGELIRKAGIMGIVVQGGEVTVGDTIAIVLPEGPHVKLERV